MNTSDNTWGLPRDLIPWGPTIDSTRCRGSGECVNFCPNSVFEFDATAHRAKVAHFYQCTVLCNNCVTVCPNGAISFPSQDEFLDTVSELRKRAQSAPGSATSSGFL
jgi:NAD-dependent dihydropyrimidine dehydrogenase PreA subunit